MSFVLLVVGFYLVFAAANRRHPVVATIGAAIAVVGAML